MGRARSRLASAFFQRDVQIAARCLPERGEAKGYCRQKHDQARTRIAGEPAMVVAHKQTAIFRWKLPEDDLQVCLRLSNADARLQARDHARVRSLVAERVTQV